MPSPHLVPLISDNWQKQFKWRGDGALPEAERRQLVRIVDQAHQQGRRVRFWAVPDNPAGWQALQAAGVDLINTDHLAGLRDFLSGKPR
jgi:glycerophosphoryl diester phosphodiesterase